MKRETKKKLRKDIAVVARAVDLVRECARALVRELPVSKGELRGELKEKLAQIDLWEITDE